MFGESIQLSNNILYVCKYRIRITAKHWIQAEQEREKELYNKQHRSLPITNFRFYHIYFILCWFSFIFFEIIRNIEKCESRTWFSVQRIQENSEFIRPVKSVVFLPTNWVIPYRTRAVTMFLESPWGCCFGTKTLGACFGNCFFGRSNNA